MKKAFKFIESLTPSFIDLLGYPTIKINSDCTEVYFDCYSVIKDLGIFNFGGYDYFRFFAGDGCIIFVFTFYESED